MNGMEKLKADLDGFESLLKETRVDVKELNKKLDEFNQFVLAKIDRERGDVAALYVSKAVFEQVIAPLKSVVYGTIAIVGASVIGAILMLVLRGK